MKKISTSVTAACAILLSGITPIPSSAQDIAHTYRQAADRLIDAALADSAAYQRLSLLVDKFGHRFTGSSNLEKAIDWILAEMKKDGLDNVRGEPVMVPHW
ncbi:MAG: peptidase M28 family protein, partial [Gemmatimonadetes bacterium]|nr:peptidase M28 family protein [Gemmatimonadota bacterium]